MYKQTVTYTDFRDQEVTEDVYFHVNKGELIKWEVESGGLEQHLRNIIALTDPKAIFAEFEAILLRAYGQRSADGTKFIKNERLKAQFRDSDAIGEIILDLMSDPQAGADFVNGILPKNFEEDISRITEQQEKNREALMTPPVVTTPPAVDTSPEIPLPPAPSEVPPNPLTEPKSE